MNIDLFRKEAVQSNLQRKLYGDVILLPSRSHVVYLTALVCWLALVFVWLVSTEYSKKSHVEGWLEPSRGIVKIFPSSDGIINKIFIAEGRYVQEGDPLIVIMDNSILVSGQSLESSIMVELVAQRDAHKKQLRRSEIVYRELIKENESKSKSVDSRLALLEERSRHIKGKKNLLDKKLGMYRNLNKLGHVSDFELESILSENLSFQSEMGVLELEIIEQKSIKDQLLSKELRIPVERDLELEKIKLAISDVENQIKNLSAHHAKLIRSPTSGVIKNLQASEGDRVYSTASTPIMAIYPKDEKLRARLVVPEDSIGFLRVGQAISIRYDAFPYQKYGFFQVRVSDVSEVPVLPGEIKDAPKKIQRVAYLASAELERESVSIDGREVPLMPGMSFRGSVALSSSRLIEWLFEPLLKITTLD